MEDYSEFFNSFRVLFIVHPLINKFSYTIILDVLNKDASRSLLWVKWFGTVHEVGHDRNTRRLMLRLDKHCSHENMFIPANVAIKTPQIQSAAAKKKKMFFAN